MRMRLFTRRVVSLFFVRVIGCALIATGEVGASRRAIVFHGDVMNTASRLENATRELGRPFLVSDDAVRRLEASGSYTLLDLGRQQLRGRAAPVHVYAVEL